MASKYDNQEWSNANVSSTVRSLAWRVAIVFMVLGVPLIVMGSWTLMTAIQANKDIEIRRIELVERK